MGYGILFSSKVVLFLYSILVSKIKCEAEKISLILKSQKLTTTRAVHYCKIKQRASLRLQSKIRLIFVLLRHASTFSMMIECESTNSVQCIIKYDRTKQRRRILLAFWRQNHTTR
jgi:hypothetical protein